jgi:hypothetical protein
MGKMIRNTKGMVAFNKGKSEKKRMLAVGVIDQMLRDNEPVRIIELEKRTGLSRSFFYNNKFVKDYIRQAQEQQGGKVLISKKDKTLNAALRHTVALQSNQIKELRHEIERLTFKINQLENEAEEKATFDYIESL